MNANSRFRSEIPHNVTPAIYAVTVPASEFVDFLGFMERASISGIGASVHIVPHNSAECTQLYDTECSQYFPGKTVDEVEAILTAYLNDRRARKRE